MSNILLPATGAALAPIVQWTNSPTINQTLLDQSHWQTVIRWTESAKPTALAQINRFGSIKVGETHLVSIIDATFSWIATRVSLLACAAFILGFVYVLGLCVYNLWFHPLAKYPGPFLAKITNLYGGYHAYKGDLHIDMSRCHEKYGNYVRYAPNRLLVNTNTGLKSKTA